MQANPPNAFNWTEDVLGPILDQGSCNDCWSFSAATAVGSLNAILTNTTVQILSAQVWMV